MPLLTRAQFRDAIRRDLQIIPPWDTGTGLQGDVPATQPNPSNPTINQAIQNAIDDINNATGFHVSSVAYPVAAQTASVPYSVSIAQLTPLQVASVADIKQLIWDDGTNTPFELTPTDYNALDRVRNTYYNMPPSTPIGFYVEGYSLYVWPAPLLAGTLRMLCGTGITGFATDGDTIDQLYSGFQNVVQYQTNVRLSKLQTMDAEAQERAANFLPDALLGIEQIKAWKRNQGGQVQPSLQFNGRSIRGSYGTRRVRK
jgi:hypothetical protein